LSRAGTIAAYRGLVVVIALGLAFAASACRSKEQEIFSVNGARLTPCKVYHNGKLKKRCVPNYYYGRQGFYVTLFGDEATVEQTATRNLQLSADAPTPAPATTQPIVPDYVLIVGWCYLSGDGPGIGTSIVVAESEASRMIVQVSQESGKERHRVVLIESAGHGNVHLKAANTDIPLAPAQYVDVTKDTATGSISVDGPHGFVYPSLAGAPQDLQKLFSDVSNQRALWNVP